MIIIETFLMIIRLNTSFNDYYILCLTIPKVMQDERPSSPQQQQQQRRWRIICEPPLVDPPLLGFIDVPSRAEVALLHEGLAINPRGGTRIGRGGAAFASGGAFPTELLFIFSVDVYN